MPNAGEIIRATDIYADAWTSYTPTWGSSGTQPAIGNGTVTGSYALIPNAAAKTCAVSIHVTMGSTTTYGTGNYTLSLPFTPVSKGRTSLNATLTDVSGGDVYWGLLYWTTTTAANLVYINVANGRFASVSNTAPVTWATPMPPSTSFKVALSV